MKNINKKPINSLETLYNHMTTLEKKEYHDDLFELHKNRGITDLYDLVKQLNKTPRRFKVDAKLRLLKNRKVETIGKITISAKDKEIFCKKYNITDSQWKKYSKNYTEQLKTFMMDNINRLLYDKSNTLWNKLQENKIIEHKTAQIANNTVKKIESFNKWKQEQIKLTYNDDITSKAELFANMYDDHYLIFMTTTLTNKDNIYTNLSSTDIEIETQIKQQHQYFIDFNKTIGYSLNEKKISRKNIFTKELTKNLNIHLHYFEAVHKDDLEKWLNTIVSARKKISAIGRIELKVIYSQKDIVDKVKIFKIKKDPIKLRILHNSKKSKLVKSGRLEGIYKITNTELEKGNHISIKVSTRDTVLEEQIKEDTIIRSFLNNKISNENLLQSSNTNTLVKDSIIKQLKYILKYATKTIEIDAHSSNQDEFFTNLSLEKLLLKHNYSDNENDKLFKMEIKEYIYVIIKQIVVKLFEEQYFNRVVIERTKFYDFCEYLKSIDIQPILETLELKEQLHLHGIDTITTNQLQHYYNRFNHSSIEFKTYHVDDIEEIKQLSTSQAKKLLSDTYTQIDLYSNTNTEDIELQEYNSNHKTKPKTLSKSQAKELLLKTLSEFDEQIYVQGTNETIHTPLLIEQKNTNLLVNMKTYKDLSQYQAFNTNYEEVQLETEFYDLMIKRYLSSYNSNKQYFYAKKFYISQLLQDDVIEVYEDYIEIQNNTYDLYKQSKVSNKKLKTFSQRDCFIIKQNTFNETIDDTTSRMKFFEYSELEKADNSSIYKYNQDKKKVQVKLDQFHKEKLQNYTLKSNSIKEILKTKSIKQVPSTNIAKSNTQTITVELSNYLNIYDELEWEELNKLKGVEKTANLIYNCLISSYHNYQMNYLTQSQLEIFSHGELTLKLLSNTPYIQGIEEEDGKYYLKSFNHIEEQISQYINSRKTIQSDITFHKKDLVVDNNIVLSNEQEDAVLQCCNSNISILTGGGGTGKTTVSKTICQTLIKKGLKIKLVSPTGAAATRMSKVIGLPASTIHNAFKININSKSTDITIDYDVLLIDESSMLDEKIAYNIFKQLPSTTKIILIGDIQQLPPVGHGRIFENLYNSNKITTASLTKTFRQSSQSEILTLVDKLKVGDTNFKYNKYDNNRELNLVNITNNTKTIINLKGEEEKVVNQTVINNICEIAVSKYFNIKESFQIIVYDNDTRDKINQQIKLHNRELNKYSIYEYNKKKYDWCLYDKVIYKTNNHKKKIMNGFTGYIVELDIDKILVKWDNGFYEYVEKNEFKDLDYAYAITIHGSQGNEYQEVFLVIIKSILDKNILYTAITRAKQKLSIFTNDFLFKKSFTVSAQLLEFKNEVYEIKSNSRLLDLI